MSPHAVARIQPRPSRADHAGSTKTHELHVGVADPATVLQLGEARIESRNALVDVADAVDDGDEAVAEAVLVGLADARRGERLLQLGALSLERVALGMKRGLLGDDASDRVAAVHICWVFLLDESEGESSSMPPKQIATHSQFSRQRIK